MINLFLSQDQQNLSKEHVEADCLALTEFMHNVNEYGIPLNWNILQNTYYSATHTSPQDRASSRMVSGNLLMPML